MLTCLRRWTLTAKVIPILVIVVGLKFLSHSQGWEYMNLSPLFSSLLGAAIFIFGFLISGILSDYKESERIPGDMSASLEAMFDEAYIVYGCGGSVKAAEFLKYVVGLYGTICQWFHRKRRTKEVYAAISGLNDQFIALQPLTDPPFISRLKQEQTALRRAVTRVHTIRETEFISSAYAIAEALAFFLVVGLLMIKIEPFYESMFFTVLVTFLVAYLLMLIRELDNPFEYSARGLTEDNISLKPLFDAEERLKGKVSELRV